MSQINHIKAMQFKHLTDIQQIEQQVQQNPWSENMLQKSLNATSWVLLQNKQVQAYLFGQVICDEYHLHNIAVAESCQRQGLASQLLNHLKAMLPEFKCKKILLEVRASNEAAKNCYQKHGFHIVTVRQNYYPCDEGREDAVIMQYD